MFTDGRLLVANAKGTNPANSNLILTTALCLWHSLARARQWWMQGGSLGQLAPKRLSRPDYIDALIEWWLSK